MITAKEALARFGFPEAEKSMVVFDVPSHLEIGFIPKKIYCNELLVQPLRQALTHVVERNLVTEIRSWDGCFNIRKKRGSTASPSLHSWGLAIDINAATNQFGKKPSLSNALVQCFRDAGFEWGGDWAKPDGMHFQLAHWPD